MESLIDSQHGTAALLASIVVVLGLHLVVKVGEFVVKLFEKKTAKSDSEITQISLALHQNTEAVRELRIQLGILERDIAEIQRIKLDVQKVFTAVKILAGKRWVEVRKAIEADTLPK